jgi:hypothetical protein
VTDGRTLSSAVATGNTAVNGVNNLTPRLSTAELSIASLGQVSRDVATNTGSIARTDSRAVSLSQTVSTNTANAGLLTSRVKTLEDAKLSAVIAALSAEASTAKASLSTTQSVLNKAIACQGKGQYLNKQTNVCQDFVIGKDIPAPRYVSMRAC